MEYSETYSQSVNADSEGDEVREQPMMRDNVRVDETWMQRVHCDAALREATGQLAREQQVRQLRSTIHLHQVEPSVN